VIRVGSEAMPTSYLEKLNPQQRRAVEYGGSALAEAGPLLIIAGAGSGKTNTLAHRVAHLIVNGTDPRRIALLTFTRRAATEMIRRVERIVANAIRERTAGMADAIAWAGTHFSRAAEVITLDQNYRSTQPILTAANAVIDLAEERFTKNLWSERTSAERPQLLSVRDEADQARYVVEKTVKRGAHSNHKLLCSAPPITAAHLK
jgi:superfamily I DNA/RNA helicase